MPKEESKGITVSKEKDIAEWYQQVCLKSNLAEYSSVKGCMVIKPAGYSIWEAIQDCFNQRLKHHNVKNAYFPLFIPESFFKKEAEHAKGFAPEVAWIANKDSGQERLAIRPTSETIIYDCFSRWIRSWRDLPFKVNQWCNVVRWETEATKLFIRSREFLWQEGHCAYETKEECEKETLIYLQEYIDLCKDLLAIPLLHGKKTEKEKFPGAETTYTIEAFMPDGKAIQAGTSHNLTQGFAKSFGIKFLGKDEKDHMPWQNSWGVSTRLIGTLVMLHSDNKGLVLPPNVAKNKLVVVPILFDDTKDKVLKECSKLKDSLEEFNPLLDDRTDYTPGWKFNEHELNGVPLRIELGPKDLKEGKVVIVCRDNGEKHKVDISKAGEFIKKELKSMHLRLYDKALKALQSSMVNVSDLKELEKSAKAGKLSLATFCNDIKCEDSMRAKIEGVKSRCIPFDNELAKKGSKCINCGKEAKVNVYFSRYY